MTVPYSNLGRAGLALLALGVLTGAPSVRAQVTPATSPLDKQAQAIVRRVDDHYNHLASLRTAYTEHYAGMGMDRSESGTLLLKKPGRMRWSYAEPAGKVFVLDGKFGWFYTPGDPQAQQNSGEAVGTICARRYVFYWDIRSYRRSWTG